MVFTQLCLNSPWLPPVPASADCAGHRAEHPRCRQLAGLHVSCGWARALLRAVQQEGLQQLAGIASLSSQPASCFLLLIHPPLLPLIPPAATCTCACCATRSCTACPSTRWTQTRCCRQAASVLLLRCWHLFTRCALLSALVAGFATACCFAASVLCTPHFATATLLPSQWPCPQERRMDLAHSAAVVLDRHNLVKYDRRSGNLQATDLGRCGYVARCSRERQPA